MTKKYSWEKYTHNNKFFNENPDFVGDGRTAYLVNAAFRFYEMAESPTPTDFYALFKAVATRDIEAVRKLCETFEVDDDYSDDEEDNDTFPPSHNEKVWK